MNTALRNTLILVVLAFVAGIFFWQNKQSASSTESPTTTASDGTPPKAVVDAVIEKSGDIGECDAETNWFPHSQTQRTDDSAFPNSSNCDFHQWAWQNFLWLTQEVDGQPRFLSFATPDSLLGNEPRGMLPRMAKSDSPESLDEYLQAGTDGIFVAHNGRSVYYSQYLDQTFVNFVQSNNLTDPTALQALIKANPATNFPIEGTAGAMELKVSWLVVTDGFDASNMFTMQTEIAKLVNKNGQIVIDTSQTEEVTVALVGFHIAGIVAGHPEMIWATFEHQRNAPNVMPGLPLDQPVSDQDYTFYSANTTLAECNVNNTSDGLLKLDQQTQTLSPITQACRQYQFGNAAGVNTINDKNIQTLNASVAKLFDPTDVWKNYAEVGAVWFKGTNTLQPGLSIATDELLAGSLSLSNATIETFTQVASTENNCFRCHNTMQQFPPKVDLQPLPASNLNISHALQNIYFWSQEDAQQPAGD